MRKVFDRIGTWRQSIQRWMLQITLVFLLTQLVAAPARATGVYEIPDLTPGEKTWVLDQADVLSRTNEGKISSALEDLAQKTGKEVHIVTIHRLDYGETSESFAKQLFEKWFPDEKAQANQVLLVLDNVTNGTAIYTGDQVKTVLSDAVAESIAQETVMVPIRQGNYNQGFLDGSDRLVAVLSGQPDPGPPQVKDNVQTAGTFKSAEETDTGNATIVVVGLLILATVIPMATYYLYQFLQSQ